MSASANALRREADALFFARAFTSAYGKYTEALHAGPEDPRTVAIIHSNRSACSFNLEHYADAMADGQAAVEADGTFVKGFMRIAYAAEAMEMWGHAVAAWESALACTADPALQADCQDKLHNAEARHLATSPPWARAQRLLNQKELEPDSSGLVILQAYSYFSLAFSALQNDVTGSSRPTGIVQLVTDAILCDDRVFPETEDFLNRLQAQVISETKAARGWDNTEPTEIKQAVQERLKVLPWTDVAVALGATVRGCIVRAAIDAKRGREITADEFYTRAIELLEWGRKNYPNESTIPGSVFASSTVLLGTYRLRLKNIVCVYRKYSGRYTLDQLSQLANDLERKVRAPERPSDSFGLGFIAAYSTYPLADSLAVSAWSDFQRGLEAVAAVERGDTSLEEARPCVHFYSAARFYESAADKLPDDDVDHLTMLTASLECQWRACASLCVTIPLAARVRDALPRVEAIWATRISPNTHAKVEEAVKFLADCNVKTASRCWALDMSVGPAHYYVD
ncbi:TPR-REGION domain-containing protein [Mycena kentingensis (nom. inval.)]|nr:TPR-REGION domain-containing protein [Mycena kentingensis (nom. inval.)]